MGWSTTVIGPPDGDMTDYLNSLEKVRDRDFATLWPTHGPPVRDVRPFVQAFNEHRLDREAQILAQMEAGQTRIKDMVSVIYADVDKRLHPAACHSVLAHMIRLVQMGRVVSMDPPCVDTEYQLA
jgi:glyoxylase-like metal-dependent hydrolase (beta-lactamase superfamily II)